MKTPQIIKINKYLLIKNKWLALKTAKELLTIKFSDPSDRATAGSVSSEILKVALAC